MKYFLLQLKKISKALPLIAIVASLLIYIVLTIFSQFSSFFKSEQESRFKVAVAGNTNSRLFNFGVTALKTLDSSRFSIDIELTDEPTAKKELLDGDISAYIVIPENFFKSARKGIILPVTYCTTASAIDLSALMRDELTRVISVLLKESQRGVFGEEQLLIENGYKEISLAKANEANINYIDFIIDRTKMYKTEIIGVSYGMDLVQYLLIGHIVIFIFVLSIPFSCLLIRRDNGLIKILSASGKGPAFSVTAEYAAMFCAYSFMLLLIGFISFLCGDVLKYDILPDAALDFGRIAFCLVPIIAMVCAFAQAIEEIAGNILSNVIGFFFISMGLCYISGCMYPLYALSPVLQKIASFTPTGAAREILSLSLTGNDSRVPLMVILAYTVLFLLISVQVRRYKLSRGDAA